MTLSDRHPIFVGYKMDGSLRRRLESLTGPERKYIADDGDFLRILRLGEDGYVGKVVAERITTDRIDEKPTIVTANATVETRPESP